MLRLPLIRVLLFLVVGGLFASTTHAQSDLPPGAPGQLRQFDTDLSKHTIDLSELRSGGPPKDGIPSIDAPSFIAPSRASDWLAPQEPVIAVEHDGEAKAYPLQILTFHEIVNDRIGGRPVAVTFCPLCYAAIVFDRRIDGEAVEFGTSGMLRNSDLVMYDRKTESLWQQLTGTAIVGDLTGQTLTEVPAQIISFEQFRANFPSGQVLSRNTGHQRNYGKNPYAGYDDVRKRPFLFDGPEDGRLPPMEKVVAVTFDGTYKAYPHSVTREERVIHDTVAGHELVVFHSDGAVSALDDRRIAQSKEVGSTGVFRRTVDGQTLTFRYEEGQFVDEETGSTWTITGRAVDGPLRGEQLTRVEHGNHFAFSWFAFRPETTVYGMDEG